MKSSLLWGSLAAIPLESANFCLAMPPIDTGFAGYSRWYRYVQAAESIILHLPGLLLSNWFEQRGFGNYDAILPFASGYLDTALLIALGIFCFRLIHRRVKNRARNLQSQFNG
jgi:hypothetical protein